MGISSGNGKSRCRDVEFTLGRPELVCCFVSRCGEKLTGVANQRPGKGQNWPWFDVVPGSDHHGSMCHAHTTAADFQA
jgi:hypothetical protein